MPVACRIFLMAMPLIFWSCSSNVTNTVAAESEAEGSPNYGPLMPIWGKALFGREISAFYRCVEPRSKCEPMTKLEDHEQECWLERTDQAAKDISHLRATEDVVV